MAEDDENQWGKHWFRNYPGGRKAYDKRDPYWREADDHGFVGLDWIKTWAVMLTWFGLVLLLAFGLAKLVS